MRNRPLLAVDSGSALNRGLAVNRCLAVNRGSVLNRGRGFGAQRGFTLIEIMVVLIILATLMTIFGSRIFGAGDRAKANMTRIKLSEIQSYIEQFRLQYNRVPGNLRSLSECNEETGQACTPIANADSLLDGWKQPFIYTPAGDGRAYVLKSLGADGREGGDGVNADISLQGP